MTARATLRAWLKEPDDAHTAEEWFALAHEIAEYLDDEDLTRLGRSDIAADAYRARDAGRAARS